MWYVLQNILLYSTVFIFSLVIFLFFYYKHAFKYWKNLGVPHSKPSFPFGNLNFNFSRKMAQLLYTIYFDMKNKGHEFCGYYMFTIPFFMPISPEIINHFLAVNFNCFYDRGIFVNEENDPVSSNMVTLRGEIWKHMKEILTPTWTAGKVKMMFPLMYKCTDDLGVVMDELIKKGELVDILEIAKRFTVDVICACALGIEGNCLKDPNNDIFLHGKMIFNEDLVANLRLISALTSEKLLKFFKISVFSPTATSFFRKLVHELVEYREKHNIETEDLLNLLIRLKNNKSIVDGEEKSSKTIKNKSIQLTVDQIAGQCFIFFLAGFETTAGIIQYALYEIAKNKNIQQRIRQEVVHTIQNFDNKITYDAIKEMRYLENVIYETLRKYPSIHMINRVCTKDFTIPNTNIIIKKGTRAVLPTLAIHMDPEYYPKPEIFDPDRFTDEAKAARPSYVYLPFSYGPRMCPGLRFGTTEVKTCIAFLLLKYKFNIHPSCEKLSFCSFGNILATANPILLSAEHL